MEPIRWSRLYRSTRKRQTAAHGTTGNCRCGSDLGLCMLQVLVAVISFRGTMHHSDPFGLLFALPGILSGLVLFFIAGGLIGLLAQAHVERRQRYPSCLDPGRVGDCNAACGFVQSSRRLARTPYGGHLCAGSVSRSGRYSDADILGLARSAESLRPDGSPSRAG